MIQRPLAPFLLLPSQAAAGARPGGGLQLACATGSSEAGP